MKVLIDHSLPFSLAHGGLQIQIEQTRRGLTEIGVETDFVRWWDPAQKADVIHYFGRPSTDYIEYAHQKGIRVVIAELLTGLGSRSSAQRKLQRLVMSAAETFLPAAFCARMAWSSYRLADACVAGTAWERQLMVQMFRAPESRVHVVPNGVEEVFLNAPVFDRGPWLVCTATITPRKRVVELAEAAIAAKAPLWVIGRPYSEQDSYYRHFVELTRQHPSILRFEGAISDRARLAEAYRSARGFVLLSTMETLSLSTSEAAACGCPLLLADLPWARTAFGASASYCQLTGTETTARILRQFYAAAPTHQPPAPQPSWTDVAKQFRDVYRGILDDNGPMISR